MYGVLIRSRVYCVLSNEREGKKRSGSKGGEEDEEVCKDVVVVVVVVDMQRGSSNVFESVSLFPCFQIKRKQVVFVNSYIALFYKSVYSLFIEFL